MKVFEAGKGINANKINENFAELQSIINTNEAAINNVADTALRIDGTNLTQEIINDFQKIQPIVLSESGDISLEDNKVYFLSLTDNANIRLPVVEQDSYSHTIRLTVQGSLYSLSLGTSKHLLQDIDVDTTAPYNVMFIFNKLDNSWYYCLTQ